jgi:hypothetical protein
MPDRTGLLTREAVATMGWAVLPHPFYSFALAHSGFCLFGSLKDALCGCHFAGNSELKHSVHEEFRRFTTEFYASGIRCLMQRWKNCVDNQGDFVEKQP